MQLPDESVQESLFQTRQAHQRAATNANMRILDGCCEWAEEFLARVLGDNTLRKITKPFSVLESLCV